MRITSHNSTFEDGERRFPQWDNVVGVVYLFRCTRTGEYKYGGTGNPLVRFTCLVSNARQFDRDLVYLWSIITNSVGTLERYWRREWAEYRVPDSRLEWVLLPDAEVARFRSACIVNYAHLPPVAGDVREALAPLEADSKYRLGLPRKPQGLWRTRGKAS